MIDKDNILPSQLLCDAPVLSSSLLLQSDNWAVGGSNERMNGWLKKIDSERERPKLHVVQQFMRAIAVSQPVGRVLEVPLTVQQGQQDHYWLGVQRLWRWTSMLLCFLIQFDANKIKLLCTGLVQAGWLITSWTKPLFSYWLRFSKTFETCTKLCTTGWSVWS